MSVLKRLEELSEKRSEVEIARSRDVWVVLGALPDLLRVVRAAEEVQDIWHGNRPHTEEADLWPLLDDLCAALEALTKEED